MKNFVFGDTGGHALPLYNALNQIGADVELGILPKDMRVIHLGDLIHKGPASKSILRVVDKFIRNNPGQWIQVLGNHEFQHIEGSPYFWSCDCDIYDVGIINDWLDEEIAYASYATTSHEPIKLNDNVMSNGGGILFTHAGLTWNWWETSNKNINAGEISSLLNYLPIDVITTPGEMLGVKGFAGPVWATGNNEVFNSWLESTDPMPFMQFHGHTTSYQWKAKRWWRTDEVFASFKEATYLNHTNRSVITKLNDNFLVGVDPGFSKTADLKVQPYTVFYS